METINRGMIAAFESHLRDRDLAFGTIENYVRHVRAFADFAGGRECSREMAAMWKDALQARGYTAATVNGMLVALCSFFRFAGWKDCAGTKLLRIQRRAFRDAERELTREEYDRLLAAAAAQGKPRLALAMETICGTGIRVSELRYVTVEAARRGEAEIRMKGKIRRILLPGRLGRKLLKYARKCKITSGPIFVTGSGKCISRRQIWAEMKALCKASGVAPSKVFPHNLRHLFARIFYKASRDIAHLADVLGHSSIDTTRIYLISTGDEHRRQLESLDLVT